MVILAFILLLKGNFTKFLKNQPCDVIKKGEMIGEVGKETNKK